MPSSMNTDARTVPLLGVVDGPCESQVHARFVDLVPGQCAAGLVFDHAGFEEIALFLQVNHLAHPRERVFLVREQRLQADLRGTPVGDVAQVALEHGCIHTEHAARHRVFGVFVFELDGLLEQHLDFGLEGRRPQVRVLELEYRYAEDTMPRGVLGLNASMFKGYLRYIANRRATQIGLDALFPTEENPFPWMSEMIDLKKERNFFETRVIEYQSGGALSWD